MDFQVIYFSLEHGIALSLASELAMILPGTDQTQHFYPPAMSHGIAFRVNNLSIVESHFYILWFSTTFALPVRKARLETLYRNHISFFSYADYTFLDSWGLL